ncbi:MAG TPA: glycosyltransferase family 39 protein [Methylomirabilota bacterium]|nr:glycosyltransferase family 39 protein [Methylomirabilota bacterium]
MNWGEGRERDFWLFAGIHLVFWTLIPLAIQPNPPLDTVELVAWGHEWRLGYPKHPPLASWLGEAARLISGAGGVWAIYLLGQLCVIIAFWAVWRLGLELTSPAVALAAILVLEATGRYTWMTLEFNHNLAVLPFFPLSALCVYRALSRRRLRWWLAAGVCLGAGILTKYVIASLGAAIAVFLISSREARRRAAGAGPYLALVAAVLVAMPHIAWMVANGFRTIAYAAERGQSDAGLAGHLLNPLDFLGRQLLMLEFIVVVLLVLLAQPWRLRSLTRDERFGRQFLLAVGLGPVALLVLVSAVTGIQLRAEWGMPLWSMLGLVVLFSFATRPGAQLRQRAALGFVLFLGINVGLALVEGIAGPYLTGRGFRTHFPGRELAAHAVQAWRQRFTAPLSLVGGERWFAGNVAFFAPSRPSVFTNVGLASASLDEAACPWTSVADFRQRGGVLVWSVEREGAGLPDGLTRHFPEALVLPMLTLPWQTGAPVKPIRVGLALVAPTQPLSIVPSR